MSREYKDEITTRGGNEVEVKVVEDHPQYELNVESAGSGCQWSETFKINPSRRASGDTELLANTLMRLGRRWALLHCP
jgi:hypothetical protein